MRVNESNKMEQPGLHGFEPPSMPKYTIVFDGGSKGNPGLGYGSFKIFGERGELHHEELSFRDRGNRVTNNEAEYLTLIAALRAATEILEQRTSSSQVEVLGDSLLVISQLRGTWKVKKAELRPFHQEALDLLKSFGKYELQWHDRINSVAILGH
jgi:ribonuclease HI